MASIVLDMPYRPPPYQDTTFLANIYSILDTDEIRLLTLDEYGPDGILRCSLRHIKLFSPYSETLKRQALDQRDDQIETSHSFQVPNYCAVSYTWEEEENIWYGENENVHRPIMVNGQILHVSNKVGNILSLLKQRGRSAIWIDALCINQHDAAEKSDQVVKMGDVFSQATEVITMLGSPDDSTDLVLQAKLWSSLDVTRGTIDQVRRGLQTLTQQSYWTRSWVLQELALARTSYIICGRRMVLSDVVSLLPRYLHTDGLADDLLTETALSLPLDFESTETTSTSHLGWKYKGEEFLNLLRLSYRFHQCRDPRDFLYSRIALAPDSSKVLPFPDYSKSTSEVFRDFAAQCILKTESLEVLTFTTPSDMKIPSWAPDWSAWASEQKGIEKWGSLWAELSWRLSWRRRWTQISRDQQEITVQGKILNVVYKDETSDSSDRHPDEVPQVTDLICHLRNCPAPVYLRPMYDHYKLSGRTEHWQDRLRDFYLADLPNQGFQSFINTVQRYKERTFRIR